MAAEVKARLLSKLFQIIIGHVILLRFIIPLKPKPNEDILWRRSRKREKQRIWSSKSKQDCQPMDSVNIGFHIFSPFWSRSRRKIFLVGGRGEGRVVKAQKRKRYLYPALDNNRNPDLYEV